MLEQIKREARASTLPRLRKDAREELIEERLKLQEAKKAGIEVSDDEVKKMLTGLAERNKMSYDQFAQHLKGAVSISTPSARGIAPRGPGGILSCAASAPRSLSRSAISTVH